MSLLASIGAGIAGVGRAARKVAGSDLAGDLASGITGVVGQGLGGAVSSRLEDRLLGSQGSRIKDVLDEAFPGTTPWEQLGAGGAGVSGAVSQQRALDKTLANQDRISKRNADTQVKVAEINADVEREKVEAQTDLLEKQSQAFWLDRVLRGAGVAGALGYGASKLLRRGGSGASPSAPKGRRVPPMTQVPAKGKVPRSMQPKEPHWKSQPRDKRGRFKKKGVSVPFGSGALTAVGLPASLALIASSIRDQYAEDKASGKVDRLESETNSKLRPQHNWGGSIYYR